MAQPHLIFGCATIGHTFATESEVSAILNTVKRSGVSRLDTAARYPPTAPGRSEELLGDAQAGAKGFAIDTKIKVAGTTTDGSLTASAIENSLNNSFKSLRISQVRSLRRV